MYLKDAAKAGREWHFKHAIVYLDKALNKIEQQRPQLKHLLRKVFFERVDIIETLDDFFHQAVEDVLVTHANVFVLLALVARCALHRWATTVCDWKKMLCCTMCSRVAGGCGALKCGVGIAGEAVVAAARKARKGTVKWCVGTLSRQSAENLQCIKQYVLAPEKNQCRFAPFYSSWCAGLL